MKYHKLFFLLLSLTFLSSCIKFNTLVNYNETPVMPAEAQLISNYQPIKIQTNDILNISISSLDVAALAPFVGQNAAAGHLVNSNGMVDLPTLGAIELKGLTMEEAKLKIQGLLKPYFTQTPVVQVRLANFRINVNGEVGNSGTFSIPTERVTMIEAITLAGDFTSYSRRDSILIVREVDGQRSFGYVNFNSADIFNSPYFYLQQNDVVYVQPQKTKISTLRDPATRILPWVSAFTSIAALTIALISRF